ncbi:MAG: ribosome small subunit-dependent GTPase A [Planctomycetes bacterium]|nr:ribosome small subunit-dependent GTPase A [Planctomycetota bacterium]
MSEATQVTGRVVRTDAKVCHVEIDGRVVSCVPRGKLFEERTEQKNPVAVGDLVRVDTASVPASLDLVLPRRNRLGRTASSHDPREQVLIANVDQLCIVASIERPKFSSNRTDRILGAALWYGVPSVLVLNKIDLDREGNTESIARTYEDIGVEVLRTSVTTLAGIEALRSKLRDKVTALYGASGVGKSSLLNMLQPGLKLKVGKISKFWDGGRHTTSFSQLHRLDFGGWVADTPGIRTFRLHKADAAALRGMFPEFARHQGACRFPDCSHDHEPGCAVFDALERGDIAASRFASYIELLDELRIVRPTGDDEDAPLDADE